MSIENKIPATLLADIKSSLIALGYATTDTPLNVIQDLYLKYVLVNQTGYNANIPYSLCYLPKSLKDHFPDLDCGGGTTPTVIKTLIQPISAQTLMGIHAAVLDGSLVLDNVQVDSLAWLEDIEYRDATTEVGSKTDIFIKSPFIASTPRSSQTYPPVMLDDASILVGCELVNLTEAEFIKIRNATSNAEYHQATLNANNEDNESQPDWVTNLLSSLPGTILKWSSKYYWVRDTPALNMNRELLKIDLDGDSGTEYTESDIVSVWASYAGTETNLVMTLRPKSSQYNNELQDDLNSGYFNANPPSDNWDSSNFLAPSDIKYINHPHPKEGVLNYGIKLNLQSEDLVTTDPNVIGLTKYAVIPIQLLNLSEEDWDAHFDGTKLLKLSSIDNGVPTDTDSFNTGMVQASMSGYGQPIYHFIIPLTELPKSGKHTRTFQLSQQVNGVWNDFEPLTVTIGYLGEIRLYE